MKKALDAIRKATSSLFSTLKQISMKKYLLGFFIVFIVLVIGLSFFKKSTLDDFYDAQELAEDVSNTYLTNTYGTTLYTAMLQQYESAGVSLNQAPLTISTDDMIGERLDGDDVTYCDFVYSY